MCAIGRCFGSAFALRRRSAAPGRETWNSGGKWADLARTVVLENENNEYIFSFATIYSSHDQCFRGPSQCDACH